MTTYLRLLVGEFYFWASNSTFGRAVVILYGCEWKESFLPGYTKSFQQLVRTTRRIWPGIEEGICQYCISRIITLNLYENYRQTSRRNTGPNVITPTVTGINVSIPYIRVLPFLYFFTALFFKSLMTGAGISLLWHTGLECKKVECFTWQPDTLQKLFLGHARSIRPWKRQLTESSFSY